MMNPEIEQAMTHLQSSDANIRHDAIKTLGEWAHTPAVPVLLDLLDSADPGTRFQIIKSLGRIADERALPALLDSLREDDPWVRAAATGSLINLGSVAVDGLIRGLGDENKAVRRAAAKALGKIGECDENAVRGLSAALLDSDKGVRRFAAEALGRLGDDVVVPELAEVLSDQDADTRIAAFKALAELDTPEARDAVRRWLHEDD